MNTREEKEIVHSTSVSNNLLLELSRLCYSSIMKGRVVVTQITWTYGPKKPAETDNNKLVREVELRVGASVADHEWNFKRLGWNAEFKMEKDESIGGWFPVSCNLTFNDHGTIRTVPFQFEQGSLDFLEDGGRDILAFIKFFYKLT